MDSRFKKRKSQCFAAAKTTFAQACSVEAAEIGMLQGSFCLCILHIFEAAEVGNICRYKNHFASAFFSLLKLQKWGLFVATKLILPLHSSHFGRCRNGSIFVATKLILPLHSSRFWSCRNGSIFVATKLILPLHSCLQLQKHVWSCKGSFAAASFYKKIAETNISSSISGIVAVPASDCSAVSPDGAATAPFECQTTAMHPRRPRAQAPTAAFSDKLQNGVG